MGNMCTTIADEVEMGEEEMKLGERIKNLQTQAFTLANIYFVSQGIVFSGVTASTTLTCRAVWFPIIVSLVPAVLNLYALYLIGYSYIVALKHLKSISTKNISKMKARIQLERGATATTDSSLAPALVRLERVYRSSKRTYTITLYGSIFGFGLYAVAMCAGSAWILCG